MRWVLWGWVLGLLACSRQEAPPAPLPPRVQVETPVVRELAEWQEYPGRLEAVEQVEVRARVEGYLERICFQAGQKVQAGDLLFVIDPRPFQIRLNQAKAKLQAAKAQLELAASNLKRAERLLAQKFIAQEDYDAKRAEFLAAEAEMEAARAEVEARQLDLSFTEVRAPIAGIAGREQVTVGNLVKGGGADATVLTVLVRTDPLYVYFDVDERAALGVPDRLQAKVEVGLAEEEGFPHPARLDYAAPRLDWPSGTRTLRAVLPNPEGRLAPGLFARVRLYRSAPRAALLVPERAVVSHLAETGVWVVEQANTVAFRRVELGPKVDGLRVIRQGLEPNARVVVEGGHKLKPGMAVQADGTL
ncbi:multidrug efflux RND transporter periplasmic adaptor subunit MexP [Methylothermus subterraneus]